MPRLFVLDAMGLAYRAHYAFIRRPLVNSRGENTSALFGFANSVLKIRRDEWPEYWALAWDGRGPTHRHLRYPKYKATRKPMPEDLLAQIPAIAEVSAALGLPRIEVPGVEADDVMATLADRAERDGFEVVLVTSDKDLVQMVDDRVRLLSPSGRGEDYVWVDRAAVHDKWGVAPEQTRDVLALMGDSTDNIPGVPGIGPKTATDLIREFGSLDALYSGLDRVEKESLRERLRTHHEQALLSLELVTVKTDCALGIEWEDLRRGPIRGDALKALAERYELQRLSDVARDQGVVDAAESPPPARPLVRPRASVEPLAPIASAPPVPFRPLGPESMPRPETARRLEPAQGTLDLWSATPVSTGVVGGLEAQRERIHEVRARAIHGLALLPLGSSADPRTSRLIGIALAARDGSTCYVPVGHDHGPNFTLDEVHGWFTLALADPSVPKVSEDLKRDAHVLANAGMPIAGLAFDLHIGSFLCDPDRDHSLAAVARDAAGIELPGLDDAFAGRAGRGRPGAAGLDPGVVAAALEPAAGALFPLADALRGQLAAREQLALYDDIEHPLIPVLYDMERAGIRLDVAALAAQSARVAVELRRLEEELYALAGERFNLKQRTAAVTSPVRNAPARARPAHQDRAARPTRRCSRSWRRSHPFPARLLEYRILAKLESTYLDALPLAVDARDGRVHTTFNPGGGGDRPTVVEQPEPAEHSDPHAAGARDPPRVRRGSGIDAGRRRLLADRAAHHGAPVGGRESDRRRSRSGEDVHANTARKIFGVTGELDPALRARAKIVNFGIMYGMGARSLSQQMRHPARRGAGLHSPATSACSRGVRDYLDRTVEEARRRGYVADRCSAAAATCRRWPSRPARSARSPSAWRSTPRSRDPPPI